MRDYTKKCKGSVSNAIEHFKTNKYKHVFIYSKKVKKYFHNPYSKNPTNFIRLYMLEEPTVDAPDDFPLLEKKDMKDYTIICKGSVFNAVEHFKTNKHKHVFIYDKESKKYFHNPLSKYPYPTRFIQLNLPEPTIDASKEFSYSVTKAATYFKNINHKSRHVMIYSKRTKFYYHNPFPNKSNFVRLHQKNTDSY